MNSNPIMYDKVIQSLCLLNTVNIESDDWFQDYRTLLPYCVKKTKFGKFIILDRNYKPLGFDYDTTPPVKCKVEYDDDEAFLPYCMDESDLDFSQAYEHKLCWIGSEHAYLYDGTCPPHSEYKFVSEYRRRLIAMFKF